MGIDTLDFFLSKHAWRPNLEPRSAGLVCWVAPKRRLAWYVKDWVGHYELFRWDDKFIYQVRDASVVPALMPSYLSRAKSYKVVPGIWLPRNYEIGRTLDLSAVLTWYDERCQPLQVWSNWRYLMTVEREFSAEFQGLGKQRVLVLDYNYFGAHEKFYYSSEWGWIGWQEWHGNAVTREAWCRNPRGKLYRPRLVCGDPEPPRPNAEHG